LDPHRINKKIADHHGLTINQVKYMRSKPAFKAEYDKQLAIYLDSFDDIQLADRKERVQEMGTRTMQFAAQLAVQANPGPLQ